MSSNKTVDEAIVVGFLYGIQSDRLPVEEVQHRVAGFRHTKGYKEATQAITQAMLDVLPEKIEVKKFSFKDPTNDFDYGYSKGFNEAISEIRTAIKKMVEDGFAEPYEGGKR